MKIRSEYTCPLELTHDIIKGKWKPIILWTLKNGGAGPAKLEKNIKGINQKMLIQQLKELMEYDLIKEKVFEGYPLRVEYYLTERGNKMVEAITIMQQIGSEIMNEK